MKVQIFTEIIKKAVKEALQEEIGVLKEDILKELKTPTNFQEIDSKPEQAYNSQPESSGTPLNLIEQETSALPSTQVSREWIMSQLGLQGMTEPSSKTVHESNTIANTSKEISFLSKDAEQFGLTHRVPTSGADINPYSFLEKSKQIVDHMRKSQKLKK